MITLNQMQLLEQKIETAVTKLRTLAEENGLLGKRCAAAEAETVPLRERNGFLEAENRELQAKLAEFQASQSRIEQGILSALQKLDAVETTIIETVGLGDSLEDKRSGLLEAGEETAQAVQPEFEGGSGECPGGEGQGENTPDGGGADSAGEQAAAPEASGEGSVPPQFDIF